MNLIPLIGYIKQGGRCSNCNVKISFYYLINEIVHLIIGLVLYSILGLSIQLLIAFLIAVILIILFMLDYKFFLLPFNINIALLLIGLIGIGYAEIFKISFLDYNNLSMSALGAFIGFAFLWLVNFFFMEVKVRFSIPPVKFPRVDWRSAKLFRRFSGRGASEEMFRSLYGDAFSKLHD